MENKKLYRSSTDKVIAGVCGGLGEYLDIDPTVLRLLSALVIVFSGLFPGALVYLLAALIMPVKPSDTVPAAEKTETPSETTKA